MKILGLVPARGGSKGVPRKNIRLLAGKPLLQYTAEAAIDSKKLDRIILSTEDAEIAEIGIKCGLEVPFLRPMELAQDSTPSLLVVQHALNWLLHNGDPFDAVCLLQPTSPLRSASQINDCIDLFKCKQPDCVFSMSKVPEKYNPHWAYVMHEDGYLHISTGEQDPIPRRQALPEAYFRDGTIYISRSSVILEQNSMYGKKIIGYLIEDDASLNIDTLDDWRVAEEYFSKKM